MQESKRNLVKMAFSGGKMQEVPAGFWHHFLPEKEQFAKPGDKAAQERAIEGHKKFFEEVKPDIMKIMNDAFIGHPTVMENPLRNGEDLLAIKSLPEDHPWITEQVEHLKKMTELFSDKVMCFYNIFSPVQWIRIRLEFFDLDFERFVYLAENYPKELQHAGKELGKDIQTLVRKLLTETKLDGIYYCVQNVQSPKYDQKTYKEIVGEDELAVLKLANELSPYNILHICGYAHHKNNLDFYKDYEAGAYNWAVHTEGISLSAGRKLFPGKCILGGFDNNPKTLITEGDRTDVEKFAEDCIEESKYRSFILGADCSVPNSISNERLRWITYCAQEKNREQGE